MTFGQQVLSTRQALHLTQAELARALERTTQTISNWECEATAPWPREQTKILSRLLELTQAHNQEAATYATLNAGPVKVNYVPAATSKAKPRRQPVGDRI